MHVFLLRHGPLPLDSPRQLKMYIEILVDPETRDPHHRLPLMGSSIGACHPAGSRRSNNWQGFNVA